MEEELLRLGHPPDPDDAYLLWALTSRKVAVSGVQFLEVQKDLETLNEWAEEGRLEVSALSAYGLGWVADRYAVLPTGAVVAAASGPVLAAPEARTLASLAGARVAVPGKRTTVALLLRLAVERVRPVVLPFDRIAGAVKAREVEAGVLFHDEPGSPEAQGLSVVADLAAWWRGESGLPAPLGVNAVRKDVGKRTAKKVEKAFRESLAYAAAHRAEALAHAARFARGMPPDGLEAYVDRTVPAEGTGGPEVLAKSLSLLLGRAHEAGWLPARPVVEMVAP